MTSATPLPTTSPFATVLIGKLNGDDYLSKADEVMSALAWAIRCGIPFPDALLTLSSSPIHSSINVTLIHNSSDWNASVNMAVMDLRKGEKLSNSLKRLNKFLPNHLIAAIAEAEESVRLIEFIQTVSLKIKFTSKLQDEMKAVLVYPVMQLLQIIIMFAALNMLIVPKFTRIYHEFYEGAELPQITQLVFNVQNTLFKPFASHIILIITLIITTIILFKTFHLFRKIIELLILKIPWIGKLYRDISLLECAETMACALASGDDIAKSANFASKTTSRTWLKPHLNRLAENTTRGMNWSDAWEQIKIDSPYHYWILRNAAEREKPMEGFASLATILRESITHETVLLVKSVELAALVFNAVLVGFIVLGLGIGIFSIIYVVL